MIRPFVTAIIPTYNRAWALTACLLSVAGQSRPCDEILVVDDGSMDGSGELVADWNRTQPQQVRYLFQENRGPAAARNHGIREARGNLLCFLDSDDCWHPRKIEMQLEAMQRSPQYRISHTRETWYRAGVLLNQKKKHQPPHGEIFTACLPLCVVGMSTVMIDRRLFDLHGFFDESYPCCEDYELWLRFAAGEPFFLVDRPLTTKHGGREDQLSRIHGTGMDQYRIRALCSLLADGRLEPRQAGAVRQELARKCAIYGQGCKKHGRPEEASYYLNLPARYPVS